MSDIFLGTILAFGFNFNPQGWLLCNGQLLSVSQNSALYALIGTYYGGDGINTFAIPDLRGRTLIGQGQGPGLSNYVIGERNGNENITLTINNVPGHVHNLVSGTNAGQATITTGANALSGGTITNETDNGKNTFAAAGDVPSIYSEPGGTSNKIAGLTSTISGTTAIAGGNQPFPILNPYLVVNYSIATSGVFPSRN
ncbi:tail fiber protein [Flavobacterium sp. AC]|uniref:Tail fiber protein n=1 Tax=Flavobacterium azizsancarii TaxID=2961580 RepID=A0ABT4WCK5_9FLAO|nr:tail fiber protein [Flavobacterium azizsancarii]MDA6070252.1 tail fiber protein [Flavobacterium azizsancarii]